MYVFSIQESFFHSAICFLKLSPNIFISMLILLLELNLKWPQALKLTFFICENELTIRKFSKRPERNYYGFMLRLMLLINVRMAPRKITI